MTKASIGRGVFLHVWVCFFLGRVRVFFISNFVCVLRHACFASCGTYASPIYVSISASSSSTVLGLVCCLVCFGCGFVCFRADPGPELDWPPWAPDSFGRGFALPRREAMLASLLYRSIKKLAVTHMYCALNMSYVKEGYLDPRREKTSPLGLSLEEPARLSSLRGAGGEAYSIFIF